MKPFVFIFRQAHHPLTDGQQKQRLEEVRTWALKLGSEGHTLDPRILGPESSVLEAAGDSGRVTEGLGDPLIALLIVDFASMEDAKKAAEIHPGRHYGVSIEVREALPPPAAATAR